MIKIILLTAPGCHECEKAKMILEEIKKTYPKIEINEIDIISHEGLKLAQEFEIMANPGIIINDELFSSGSLNKDRLISKIETLSNYS